MNDRNTKWWQLTVASKDPETDGCQIVELGASGAHVVNEALLTAFYEGTYEELSAFQAQLKCAQLDVKECVEVQQENWLEDCEELWSPLVFNTFQISPVASVQDVPTQTTQSIPEYYIIPSTGFGTGHHATTFSLLQFLEHKELKQQAPSRVLDLGTGSGILAIAAAKLLDCQVEAIEPDRDAIHNARENIDINGLADKIELLQGDIASAGDGYDLIMANIYAEILIPLADEFYTRLSSQGQLFLSGIAAEHVESIKSRFLEAGFSFQREVLRDNWYSAWLKKG